MGSLSYTINFTELKKFIVWNTTRMVSDNVCVYDVKINIIFWELMNEFDPKVMNDLCSRIRKLLSKKKQKIENQKGRPLSSIYNYSTTFSKLMALQSLKYLIYNV